MVINLATMYMHAYKQSMNHISLKKVDLNGMQGHQV